MQELDTVKAVFRLLSPAERKHLAGLGPLLAISSIVESVGVGAIFAYLGALNSLADGTSSLPLPYDLGAISVNDKLQFALVGGIALVAIFITKILTILGISMALMRFVFQTFEDFSVRLFNAYLRAPFQFHLRKTPTEIQRNMNLHVPLLFNSVAVSITYIASNGLATLIVCTLLAWLEPWAFLLASSVLIVVCGLSYSLHKRRLGRLGTRRAAFTGGMMRVVAQAMGAIHEIKIAGREVHFERLFRQQTNGLGIADRAMRVSAHVPSLTNELTLVTGVVAVVLLYLHTGGDLPDVLPILAAFGLAGIRITGMFSSIVYHLHQLRYYGPTVQTISAAAAELAQQSASATEDPEGKLPIRLRTDITFDRVCFQYPNAEVAALSEVSITVKRGSRVAFIGESGSGKSTLALLATGLLDPTSGSILVDGVPIAADRAAWFGKVAYVPQSVFILDDTVRANIAFYSERQSEDSALWEVLEVAQLEEVVRRLPAALDTPLGEHGAMLSGGERQRIAIARALFRRPEVLILDEATSALDGATEARLVSALVQHCSGCTILAAAHRPSLARVSDRVVWLDRGQIRAAGDYEELLKGTPGFRDILAH